MRTHPRDARQLKIFEWGKQAFGEINMISPQMRAIRLLEEAIEVYQAAGCDPNQAKLLVDYVFGRPSGTVTQELGGVGVCVLAMAECLGASADYLEEDECERLFSKPMEHFTKRNQAKIDAGFKP